MYEMNSIDTGLLYAQGRGVGRARRLHHGTRGVANVRRADRRVASERVASARQHVRLAYADSRQPGRVGPWPRHAHVRHAKSTYMSYNNKRRRRRRTTTIPKCL